MVGVGSVHARRLSADRFDGRRRNHADCNARRAWLGFELLCTLVHTRTHTDSCLVGLLHTYSTSWTIDSIATLSSALARSHALLTSDDLLQHIQPPCRPTRISRRRSTRSDRRTRTRQDNTSSTTSSKHTSPDSLGRHAAHAHCLSCLHLPISLNPRVVKDLINTVLVDQLKTREYDQNETGTWTKEIATQIKGKLKALDLPRYKFLVQVIIGEMKGAGVRSVGVRSAAGKKSNGTRAVLPSVGIGWSLALTLFVDCCFSCLASLAPPAAAAGACGTSRQIRWPRRPFRM